MIVEHDSCLADARGAVMLEFLLCFVPVFVLFLGTVQYLLLAVADLVVRHAAVSGVRAAVVVLADDAKYYAQEPIATIERGSRRLATIRRAVTAPLAAIAPDAAGLVAVTTAPTSLSSHLGGNAASRFVANAAFYDAFATALTFPIAPASTRSYEDRVEQTEELTLRVTHLYRCGVPLAAALLCETYAQLELAAAAGGELKQALKELRRAPSASLHPGMLATSLRFRVLRAEATLPTHFAREVGDDP